MALSDTIGDMITRIRNAQKNGVSSTVSPCSKLRLHVLDVLKREGYIRDYSDYEVRKGVREIKIELKYREGQPVIREINRASKPGRRLYCRVEDLPKIYGGLGISILSTSRGVLSDGQAREANVGGELLCTVF